MKENENPPGQQPAPEQPNSPLKTQGPRFDIMIHGGKRWVSAGAVKHYEHQLECAAIDNGRLIQEVGRQQEVLLKLAGSIDAQEKTYTLKNGGVVTGQRAVDLYEAEASRLTAAFEEIRSLRIELGALHGRIGLFAAKYFGLIDNLPTEETFAKMEAKIEEIVEQTRSLSEALDKAVKS